MKKVFFYFHAGSHNHGCEAIVRSSAALLNIHPIVISENPEQDYEYKLNEIADIVSNEPLKTSVIEKCIIKSSGEKSAYLLKARQNSKTIAPYSIALSVGGDNYCYGDQYNWYLEGLNRFLHKKKVKTVLWGCSINPDSVSKEMENDFRRYDLVVARESISYGFLRNINNNTILACDPAFTLEPEILPLPEQFKDKQTIGINISPLILRAESKGGVVYRNYIELIKYIIRETSYNIALIPHVRGDIFPLRSLWDYIEDINRVCMLDDTNCSQLKGFISRLKMFVGTRTHSTIAAYSSFVPTLVIGYSTKSIGIARDLFGNENNYVVRLEDMETGFELKEAFEWLDHHHTEIKHRLEYMIPQYSKSIYYAAERVKEL